jgi:hypothetical protein
MATLTRFNKNKHQMQQTFNQYKSQSNTKVNKYKSQQIQKSTNTKVNVTIKYVCIFIYYYVKCAWSNKFTKQYNTIKYKSQQVQSQQIWQSIIKSIQTCACDYDYDYDYDGVVLCNFHPNPTSPIH